MPRGLSDSNRADNAFQTLWQGRRRVAFEHPITSKHSARTIVVILSNIEERDSRAGVPCSDDIAGRGKDNSTRSND
jgi:hypothetical protein